MLNARDDVRDGHDGHHDENSDWYVADFFSRSKIGIVLS